MRISDWSSDVCSSDLSYSKGAAAGLARCPFWPLPRMRRADPVRRAGEVPAEVRQLRARLWPLQCRRRPRCVPDADHRGAADRRSEEHTSELQSLMRISYAVFCLKKKNNIKHTHITQSSPTT